MSKQKILHSALWAALGDALGFVSELSDEKGFSYRLRGNLDQWGTTTWRRKVGGKYGVEVIFPAGTYSDDTQLRLAVSRSIGCNGLFQRDAFAKIELPVWRAYALGAGVGSLTAAENLTKASTSWYSNVCNKYFMGGGNGAAMRIQPHIWACPERAHPRAYLVDVLCDAIITHGHGRGILGAAFHAICLAACMNESCPIGPRLWGEAVQYLRNIPSIMDKEFELAHVWRQQWQTSMQQDFQAHVDDIADEFMADINIFTGLAPSDPVRTYNDYAKMIGAVNSNQVGSGVKTSILAMVAAYLFRNEDPLYCLKTVASLIHSDTDTIGTMTGALVGVFSSAPPSLPIQDKEYISLEATRLADIATGENVTSFTYPSILSWKAPRGVLDCVTRQAGVHNLVGLGMLTMKDEQYTNKTTKWSWANLPFGQNVLVKMRPTLKDSTELPAMGNYELPPIHQAIPLMTNPTKPVHKQKRKCDSDESCRQLTLMSPYRQEQVIEDIVSDIANKGFPKEDVGSLILQSLGKNKFEDAVALLMSLYKKYRKR